MRERNLLDDIDEIEQAARQTPSERFAAGLALSDLAIAMLRGNPDAPVLDRLEDLEDKARLWAAPLRLSLSLSPSATAAGAATAAGTASASAAAGGGLRMARSST